MIDLCHGTDFVVIYRIMRTTAAGLKQKYINKETEHLHAILEKKMYWRSFLVQKRLSKQNIGEVGPKSS